MTDATTTERSTEHATFAIERTYPHLTAHVFQAFADIDFKAHWFGDAAMLADGSQGADFREGGAEHLHMTMGDGTAVTYDSQYIDIVPDTRIIYAYEMSIRARRISATVASVEFFPVDEGTRLVLTEHGIYLDGLDQPAQRQGGTEQLLDKLGAALDEAHA